MTRTSNAFGCFDADRRHAPRNQALWRRTCERLQERCSEADESADQAFVLHAGRLLARIDKPKSKRSFWR
jgi:hypothetical protein